MSDNKFEENRHYNYETRVNYNGFPENMTTFNSLPVKVKVHKLFKRRVFILTWSNQGMSLGEWIKHLFSISKPEKSSSADFHVYNSIEFDIPTLRNIFPKLESIFIFFCYPEAVNEHEKLSAQIFLKAFLPYVQQLRLDRIRLGKHFSIGDFGMTNLKKLEMYRPCNLKVEDLKTLNAENITIGETNADEITLQNLNHFFKLWISGSNPKLKELKIWWYTRTNPDWIVLLKELEADNAGEETAPEDPMVLLAREEGYVWLNEGEAAQNVDVAKKFIIRNSRGFAAQMKCYTRTSSFRNTAHVEFTVSI
ncbi:hypothetical protein B9Z55_011146 [Caenorhabditis nigoni]|uniref:Sdz-33 F-box domain-containing protein n=1 Tax=Caenorhabditis nigoni TaxID=1611254 RepID=A0A2G5UIS8_9PELO|nr:hypothetical protein B9Z55_011146 [Caenorhabditis nigoni]